MQKTFRRLKMEDIEKKIWGAACRDRVCGEERNRKERNRTWKKMIKMQRMRQKENKITRVRKAET